MSNSLTKMRTICAQIRNHVKKFYYKQAILSLWNILEQNINRNIMFIKEILTNFPLYFQFFHDCERPVQELQTSSKLPFASALPNNFIPLLKHCHVVWLPSWRGCQSDLRRPCTCVLEQGEMGNCWSQSLWRPDVVCYFWFPPQWNHPDRASHSSWPTCSTPTAREREMLKLQVITP